MSYLAGLHASTLRKHPRQSRILSGQSPAEISARFQSRPASCAVRRRCALMERPICCTKHRACLWQPVRCQRIVRASFARMPTAAPEIDACSERAKQTAGLQVSKAAGGELGGRRKNDLRFKGALSRFGVTGRAYSSDPRLGHRGYTARRRPR
jgi:hypothetical protein